MAAKPVKGQWADLAVPGAVIAIRVTPGARANRLAREGEALRARVTAPPEEGRATAAVAELLAKTRLVLVSGATHRDKRFRLD